MHSSRLTVGSSLDNKHMKECTVFFFSSWGVAYSFIIAWAVIFAWSWPRSKKILFIVIYYCSVNLISCMEIKLLFWFVQMCPKTYFEKNHWILFATQLLIYLGASNSYYHMTYWWCNTIPYCNESCSVATKNSRWLALAKEANINCRSNCGDMIKSIK